MHINDTTAKYTIQFVIALLLTHQKFHTYFSKEPKFKTSMFYISIVHAYSYLLLYDSRVVILFEILARSATWEKYVRRSVCEVNKFTRGKTAKRFARRHWRLFTRLVYSVFPWRRTFVTALQNACEGDKETYEVAARASAIGTQERG